MSTIPRHYISTACHHEQHEKCRLDCKFCDAPCRCTCHKGEGAVSRRRLAGTRWRVLAHYAPTGHNGMYGDQIETRSDDANPSVFDEIVCDQWLHIEQQGANTWWASVGGVVLWVTVSRDGKPTHVTVYGPGDYDTPVEGCAYEHVWSAP